MKLRGKLKIQAKQRQTKGRTKMHYSTKDLARFINEKMNALPMAEYDKFRENWNISTPLVDLILAGYIQSVSREGRQAMEEAYNCLEYPGEWS